MLGRGRLLLVLGLSLAGALLSLVLLFEHHGEPLGKEAVSSLCGETGGGCETVNKSPYASISGMPLAGLGLAFYASLATLMVLALLADPEAGQAMAALALLGLALALLVDVVLLGLQAGVIHAFCKLCLATYVLNTVALAALAPARSALTSARAWLGGAGARPILASWLLASLAFAVSAKAGDVALAVREHERERLLLGDPAQVRTAKATPEPTPAEPSPTPTPSAQATLTSSAKEPAASGDAAHWRDEAHQAQEQLKKLQDTIDDPQKLQQYLKDKAVKDYDNSKPMDVDLSQAPVRGPANAPVKVVTYSDFLCPWCRQLAGALGGFLPQTSGRVTLYFKNYPLDQTCNDQMKGTVHAGACWLAFGAMCANDQGKFWPYHDKVMTTQFKDPKADDVIKLVEELGFNTQAFETCLNSAKTKERVLADIHEGKRVGVSATPTVLINGKKLPNLNMFLMAIDKELQRMGLPPVPAPQQPGEGK
jgi:protein-disulfide isomerase/uncharacterized membrane protein